MSSRKRRGFRVAIAAVVVSAVVAVGAAAQPASAACVSTTSQGGSFSGRLLVGPPGQTFATYIRTTVSNVNVLGWWGTVTVHGQLAQTSQTMWLAPWYLPGSSRTINGPIVIAQQYVYFTVDVDPLSDATQVGLRVCA
jgi:hypothetical protein